MIHFGRPSPALVVAFIALAVALSGSAVALTGSTQKAGGGKALDLKRVKANPLEANDPCESGETGVFCGYDSVSGLRGWSNLGEGFEPVAYAIDSENVVHLQGVMAQGPPGGAASFILPKQYRPAGTLWFTVAYGQQNNCSGEGCDESVALLQIEKNGHVHPIPNEGVADYWGEGVAVDGVTFVAK